MWPKKKKVELLCDSPISIPSFSSHPLSTCLILLMLAFCTYSGDFKQILDIILSCA